ncbi:pyridoxamine 5'-phosphate oxidase family protein [Saccharomonospora marina]|uniref:pyridoxamine 5'-phosphate oxidase family protein n=1 Tax=Saccharomonospora marina TaxID=632569 RepID=UPI0002F5D0E0|nr:PPOX class F420-dependent oxidoreductase [Saccharomonospora marina]
MGVNQRAEVRMTDDEIAEFLGRGRVATLATNGPDGTPHLVAMWYGYLDGRIYFETKAKSQKAVNLRRDPTVVCMVESGDTYDQLRGVSVEGTAHLIDDPADEEYWAAGVNVFERYHGPYTEQARPMLEMMLNKRVIVRVEPKRVRSWDHRKLGLPAMPVGGSTAPFLHNA